MNNRPFPGLQPSAAARLCYWLLDVQALRDDAQQPPSDRAFIETKSHVLLLSNGSDGRIIVDGRLHVLKPGCLFICAPGQLLEVTNFGGQTLELLMLYFQAFVTPNGQASAHMPPEGTEPAFPVLGEALLPSAAMASQLFGVIETSWKQGTDSARLRCEAGLLELLSHALTHRERLTEMALELARLELERHYASEIAIESLARIAGLSRFHFMRLFKERFGKGVVEYRTELRLREAKRLMGSANLTLAEIALRIGYTNESYFSSLFKKQTGMSPAAYLRSRQRRIAAYSWINLGQLLALRTIPVAAPMDHYWTSRYRNKYEFEVATPLSHHYEFNLKALRQAKPDGIVAIGELIPPAEQKKLQQLAPTLFLSWNDDWRTHLVKLAAFLEREEEAEAWLRKYDRDAAAVRARIAPVIGPDRLLVLSVGGERLTVWGRQAGSVLYGDLEIAMPPELRDTGWHREITPSELAGIQAERILVHVEGGAAAEAAWRRLALSEAWLGLPAVRRGSVHAVIEYGCFDAPWNDYAAEPIGRFLNDIPELLGIPD
ncbi:AraC family transcriptional regulator [Paenibacillus lycopersici]|uniref:AraC family transcriptional regulator n=1 Tax=Paenibacillus lycopersici TaxID=2704462 RepID=A0A6C0G688_9BACL|nr:AraC family transcriptional regulator [Paenibacillus lycopersici]QHT60935.1 AraC family transcriptional regulator [Paenibacillus lycopersici]